MEYEVYKRRLINMVKEDTIPAIGCTEPVAVAYACSIAGKYLKGSVEEIKVYVSKNIYKNGKSVVIPNTNERGLDLAAALGTIGGKPEEILMVLKNIDEKCIQKAHELIREEKVIVKIKDVTPEVYVEVIVSNEENVVEVIIKDDHSNIECIKVNGKIIFQNQKREINNISVDLLKELTFKDIIKISESIDINELYFIRDGINMNKKAALEGINCSQGLGTALIKIKNKWKIPENALIRARILTAAGADYRMSGGSCPIMTSAGSGNQGLGVILPIVVTAEEHNINEEKLLKAVFLGHVINKYVKVYTGKLSAMCGCAISAGVGASAGITWMLGGNYEQICGACQNIFSNLTGMICDGAKETCALKLSTSAQEAILASYLAMENIIVNPQMGIIGKNIEETIKNVGALCKGGFIQVDKNIIDIIS